MMEVREEVPPTAEPAAGETWELRQYVASHTAKSVAAPANLRRYCEPHVPGRYQLEGTDLFRHPQLAEGDQILAISTVVWEVPGLIGGFSDGERVLVGLDRHPQFS